MALLEVQNLTKHYGGIRAVDDCTFSVEEGTITSLIGPNGAGKTTAFNLITGTTIKTSGTIRIGGVDTAGLPPHKITRMGVSRTFQITRTLNEMSVLENLVVHALPETLGDMIGSSVRGHDRDRAMSLLEFLGIAHLARQPAGRLSYGQRKLLELGAVLMSDPRLIMLDEPAGGVNPTLLETIAERIQELNGQGVTFLIVEHNMDFVMSMSNPVIVMAAGTVIAQGSPEQVQENPEVLDAYLGGGA